MDWPSTGICRTPESIDVPAKGRPTATMRTPRGKGSRPWRGVTQMPRPAATSASCVACSSAVWTISRSCPCARSVYSSHSRHHRAEYSSLLRVGPVCSQVIHRSERKSSIWTFLRAARGWVWALQYQLYRRATALRKALQAAAAAHFPSLGQLRHRGPLAQGVESTLEVPAHTTRSRG